MQKYLYGFIVLCLPLIVEAAPNTTYRGVERYPTPQVNHHPNPVFNHQAPKQVEYHPYQHSPYYDRRYPSRIVQRPQIAIVTPHVGIYVEPEPAYHYQHTEEIYLPYGGTYRSVTEHVPQTVPYHQVPSRRVVNQGYFNAE